MGQHGKSILSKVPNQRQYLIDALERNGGTLIATAHDLGVHRDTVYRYVRHMNLWPIVNEARRRRLIRAIEERRKREAEEAESADLQKPSAADGTQTSLYLPSSLEF